MKNLDMYVESFKLKYEAFLLGCDSLEETGDWDIDELGEMDVFYANDLISVIIRLIAADGKIDCKEAKYLNDTFGFEYSAEELRCVYDSCKDDISSSFDENFENGISYMRRVNSKLADAYKELLSLICDIIIESDGMISEAEIKEVSRLKALCE